MECWQLPERTARGRLSICAKGALLWTASKCRTNGPLLPSFRILTNRHSAERRILVQTQRLAFSQSSGKPAAPILTVDDAGNVVASDLKRWIHPELGLMVLRKWAHIQAMAYARVKACVSAAMCPKFGASAAVGHLGCTVLGLFQNLLWCAQIFRVTFKARSHVSII